VTDMIIEDFTNPEVVASVDEFVSLVLTDARLEQGQHLWVERFVYEN